MSFALLSTKLHIPRVRAKAVIRPRLIEKVLAGVRHPGSLTLLSGPAGFGKTTLLSTFAAEFGGLLAWVSLDEEDNDPNRFWTYLLTACQSVQKEIGESALALLQSPQPVPPEAIPTVLINDLVRLDADLVIILDDYHVVQNSTIHSALAFLLDHLPEKLHVVISTRVDPPWPLARFRARNQLVEVRAADLRFTTNETAAFLNEVMGLELSAENISALEARTEGWIASLQLAALSMKGRRDLTGFIEAFTGSHMYVAEYLMEEVLTRQSEEIKDFLLRSSVLERFNASLCQAVTGRPESLVLLQKLYQSNLFIVPLDDEGQWFRYHQLFADLLRAHLSQAISEDDLSDLHQSAMDWFEQNGFVNEAINHALAARDFRAAARLVDENAYQAMTRGELTTLLRWTEALPEDMLRLHPSILIKKAWALTLAGAIQQVEPLLQQAEAQLAAADQSLPALEISGNAAAIRAFFAMMAGDYPRAIQLAERAHTLLPESDVHVSWLVPYTLGSVHRSQGNYGKAVDAFARQAQMAEKYGNLILWATGVTEVAIVRRLQGQLHKAAKTCRQALQTIAEREATHFGSLAKLEVPLIDVLREQNQLEEAQQRLVDVMGRMQNWPMPTDRLFSHLAQLRVQEASGDLAGAMETLSAARDWKAKHPVLANLARAVDLSEIRLALKKGDVETAARLIDDLHPGTSRSTSLREEELMLLARIELAQGRLNDADKVLSALASEVEAGQGTSALIELLVLQACVRKAMGNNEAALSILIRALRLAEPEGFVRVFLEGGEAMQQLLTALSRKLEIIDEPSTRLKEYVARLREAFPDSETGEETHRPVDRESALIDPLTARELQVLQLIASGDSNQVIAQKLFITLSAVKKHTGNIFGKLSVNSRTQAVARARQLGLLASDT